MGTLLQDIRYGLRMLGRSPGFTVVVILTLALGIGANTAIFSVVNAVLLRPLPYKNPDQLVAVYDMQPGNMTTPASFPEYLDWREQTQVFQSVAAYMNRSYVLTGAGTPEQIRATGVSASYLPMLGIEPAVGRSLRPAEEPFNGERAVLLSYASWKGRFGGDPSILGKTLVLDARPFTVVGILPEGFLLPNRAELMTGLGIDPKFGVRSLHFLGVNARLRPGLTLAQARKEIQPVAERLRKERASEHGIELFDLKSDITQGARAPLYILLSAVGFVLLIACANIASILLARSVQRKREMAIRATMGAGRLRLVRQLLTESILLGLAGGVCSLLIAKWGLDFLVQRFANRLPRWSGIQIDSHVLFFALGISIFTGMLFGVLPAWESLKVSLYDTLKEGGRWDSGVSSRKRGILVVCEVALSLVLLISAGLLIRSFGQLLRVNKGFDSDRVLTFGVVLPVTQYADGAKQSAFFEQSLDRLKNLPGVEAAGMVNVLPLTGSNVNGDIGIEGQTFPTGSDPMGDKRIVSADYFRAMRIPLVRGRYFSAQDRQGAPPVAIINQAFAQRYFPNEDPIGKRIEFRWDFKGFQEIVGVVGNVRHNTLAEPVHGEVYVSYLQRPDMAFEIVMRTKTDPASLVPAARAQILSIDASQPITDVATMEDVVSQSLTDQRTAMWLLGVFAALALGLTVVGIYGVISYSVTQRTREIGLRMALGAQPSDVLRQILGGGFALAITGVGIGLAAAVVLTRLMAAQLYGVSPRDPVTFAAVALVLIAIAMLACYIPARRAMRVDPMESLRYE